MLKVSVTITHPSGGAKTNKSFSNKEQANEYIESLHRAKIEYARKKSKGCLDKMLTILNSYSITIVSRETF